MATTLFRRPNIGETKLIMDDSAKQLQRELSESVRKALATGRPILTHINADTTWLLQLPYPGNVTPPPDRSHYNILVGIIP